MVELLCATYSLFCSCQLCLLIMEEFEDLVPQPDDEGRMELTYRAWTEVDDVVWTMGRTLIFLDVSFNSIKHLPDELGDLYQLKELNCACNQIANLPGTIGKLIKLQVLKANGNKIDEIPDTIGKGGERERERERERRKNTEEAACLPTPTSSWTIRALFCFVFFGCVRHDAFPKYARTTRLMVSVLSLTTRPPPTHTHPGEQQESASH